MLLLPLKSVSLLLALRVIPAAALNQCYNLDGKLAEDSVTLNETTAAPLFPCQKEGPSTCCFKGIETCSDNLLCYNPKSEIYSRQYCSDKNWPEDRCSKMCPRLGDAGAVLRQCPGSENKFCCPYDGPECCEQGEYYEIDDKGIILTHGNTTITPTSSRTSSPSSPPTSSTTSSTTSSSTADGGSGTIKLGVGLGVGLGVPFLLICAAAVFILQRYQRLRVNAAPTEYSSTKGLAPAYSPPVVSPKPPAELDGKHMRPELAASEHLAQELP